MKIIPGSSCASRELYASFEEWAKVTFDWGDSDRGAFERVETTARQNSQALGRMLDLLVEKDLISAEEGLGVVGGYAEIVEEGK